MKEFNVIYQECFKTGLRRFEKQPVGVDSLVECHNLAPSESGLEPHETIISMNSLTGDLIITEAGVYLVDGDGNEVGA